MGPLLWRWRSGSSREAIDKWWPLGLRRLQLYGPWSRLTCDLLDGLETKLHLWSDGSSSTGCRRHGKWTRTSLDRPGAGADLDRSRPGAGTGTGLDGGRPGAGLDRCGTGTCDGSTLNSSGLFGCCRPGSGSERLGRLWPVKIVEYSEWNGSGLLGRTSCSKAGARTGSQCRSWGGRSWLLNELRLRESWRRTGLWLTIEWLTIESWRKSWTGLGLSNSKSWRWTGLGLTCDWESSCRESSGWLTSNGSSISGKPWWLLTRGRASGGNRARRPNGWEWLEEKAA